MNSASRSRVERIARWLTASSAVGAVATVAVVGLPARATERLTDLPERDTSAWTMPLDAYLPIGTIQDNYAENLLNARCLAASGFEWPVPWRDAAAADNALGEATVARPLTPDVAASRGYHVANEIDEGRSDWVAFAFLDEQPNAALQAALDACIVAGREEHPLLSGQAMQAADVAVKLANAAYRGAVGDSAVRDTVGAWRACMAPADIPDLTSPDRMPTTTMFQEFRTGIPTAHPSEREASIASLDLACQDSSGYRDALYRAEWERQAVQRPADAALFRNAGDAIERRADAVRSLLAELTPPRPARYEHGVP